MQQVQLKPMTAPEYERWYQYTVSAYQQEKVNAGDWTAANAAEMARASYQRLLPAGHTTAGELLLTIWTQDQAVGSLWVHVDQTAKSMFIYDIIIDDQWQNQGLGQATLAALAVDGRRRGIERIGLHVFGNNLRAQQVYRKMGFAVTDMTMMKRLTTEDNDD